MRLAVLFFVIAIFLLLVALLSGVGKRADSERRRLAAIKGGEREYGDEELKRPFSERVLKPITGALSASVRRMAGKSSAKKQSKSMEKLEKQLKTAGLSLSAREYTYIKSIATVGFLVLGIVLYRVLPLEPMLRLLVLLVCMCVPVYGAKFFLNGRVKKRKEAILRELPDVMDLLVVSVEAGLGLDAAIARLYSKTKNVVLTELMGSVRDIQMGLSRKNSLKEMADRCDVKELTSFVTALIQAEQLGVSMKSVLISQSDRLRTERRQRVQEKAQKAPIKMMLPTVCLIFPVMFIILLGPAAVNLIDVLM